MSLTLAFALTFASGAAPSRGTHAPWFGRDKVKHFVAAAALQSVGYALLSRGETSRPAALWRATAITGAASLGKELVDWRRGRPFSGHDLVADAAGAGAATVAIMYASRK